MRLHIIECSRTYHFKRLRLCVSVSLLLLIALFSQACGDAVQQTTNAYVKARPEANEAATLMTLKTISSAQQNYLARGNSSYGTFNQLVEAGALDQRFNGETPVVGGYAFTMKLTGGQPPGYSVNADPQPSANRPITGSRHYYLDSKSGTIRVNDARQATADDSPLQ
jgi:hypothetical protein